MQIQELSFGSLENNKSRIFLAECNQFTNSFDILRYVLYNYFDINIGEADLYYGKYGKPYLKNNKVYFNISHSGKYIVLAVSSKEIGVDIQLVKSKVCWTNLFLEDEHNLVKNSHSNDSLGFSILWSCKESYLKKTGFGLSIEHSTVLFDSINSPIYYDENFIKWTVLTKDNEQYVISLCLGED